MKSMKNVFLPLLILLTASGCDLLKTDVVKSAPDTSKFSLECELDIDQFSKILSEDISSQLRCLEESLNLFIDVVKTTKPGYMKREALEAYVKNNQPEIGPTEIKALKAVYDVNHLITGDDPGYISKKNVKDLIEFAILFNAEMSLTIKPLFSGDSDISFSAHELQRKLINVSSKKIIQGLKRIFNYNPGNGKRDLNIVRLLESFTTESTEDDIAKILKVLFLKKVLFGGARDVLTYEEVDSRVLTNLNQIVLSVFDIVRVERIKDLNGQNKDKIYNLLERNVKSLGDIITNSSFGNRDRELFFTVDEAIDVAEMLMTSDDFKISDWKDLIFEAKKVLMGGSDQEVLGLDFKNLIGHANNILRTGNAFYNIYRHPRIQEAMDNPNPVTLDFNEFKNAFPERVDELDQFSRISKRYRFFKGNFNSAFYTKGIRRNADAMVETYLYEYLLMRVMKTHGHPNSSSLGGYGITQAELGRLVTKLEKTLIKLELILPHRKDSITDNISLLGTLFQYQSDKNGVLDANEATEFTTALLTSMDMADNMLAYFRSKGCQFEEKFNRVEPTCFKQNFFKALCEGVDGKTGYRQNFPLLFESLGARSCDDLENTDANLSFLDVSINAARSCNNYVNDDGSPGEEIYFSHGDIFSTLMVLMHAETTTLRWDDVYNKGNGNNVMDPSEVDRAYEIYSPALDGFLEGKPAIIKGLKKQIYQYLIKYETIPDEKEFSSIWKFIKFLVSFNKKAPAYRRTLAAILSEIGKQNAITAASQGKPKFQCNWLRNPDTIPETIPEVFVSQTAPKNDYSGILNYIYRSGELDEQGEPVFRSDGKLCIKVFSQNYCL